MALNLKDPPIVEVICGIFFPEIAVLDPVVLGGFWSEKRSEYPKREIHPPVADVAGVQIRGDVGALRTWLIGTTGEYLMQIQPDRFYFNWRRGQNDYPHFSDHGDEKGVLSKGLAEFQALSEFCAREVGTRPDPRHVQLAKVDLLRTPNHWKDFSDLAQMVPLLGAVTNVARSGDPNVGLSFSENRNGMEFVLQVGNMLLMPDGKRAVQIETRVTVASNADELRSTFENLNAVANDAFFALLTKEALIRFGADEP